MPVPSRRRVLVAGATGRVGLEVARQLAAAGTDLVLLSRHGSVDPDLKRYDVEVMRAAVDIRDEAGLAEMAARLREPGARRLDGVVNCVTGYDGKPRALAAVDGTTFRDLLAVDLVGAHQLVSTLRFDLSRSNYGRVVLMSSLAGVFGRRGAAHLCAAKAGVLGLVRALAHELADDGVLVNAVAPGPIASADHPSMPPNRPVTFSTPAAVAATVVQLLSPACAITGQTIQINGGRP